MICKQDDNKRGEGCIRIKIMYLSVGKFLQFDPWYIFKHTRIFKPILTKYHLFLDNKNEFDRKCG